MRDRLRYRAWDKENKRYIYGVENGLQFYSTAGNLRVMVLAEIEESNKYDLEQCTGCRDYERKLIYANDILKLNGAPNIYQCIFSTNRVGFDFKPLNAEYKCLDFFDHARDFIDHCKIVGNIHQDSKLLEGE